MVTHLNYHISGASVRFLTPAGMVRFRTQHQARQDLWHALFIVWVLCLWNSVLEAVPVGYGTNDNRLTIRGRGSGWIAILIAYLHQRLLLAIINFLGLSDEGSSPKESGCTVLASLPVFELVFTASIVLYHQCCAALSYIATIVSVKTISVLGNISDFFQIKETSLITSEMF